MIGLTVSLLSCVSKDNSMSKFKYSSYPNGCCISYSEGYVYIGDKSFLSKISDDISINDVLVEDLRFSSNNPDMKVRNSCQIHDVRVQEEIISILCEYERCYPSPWDRSKDSMQLEWFVHNLSYDFNYSRDRSRDVDFDNDDQFIYENPALVKMYKL